MELDTCTITIISIAILSVAGIVAWAWIAIAHTVRGLRSLKGFEGIHFEDQRNDLRNSP